MVADTETATLGTTPTTETTTATTTTTPTTSSEVVVETFNETEVTNMIDEFEGLGDDVYSSLDSMDSLVADNVQVASGAVAGKVGQELFTQWSENCVPLLNYTRFFDGISESMRRIYNRSSETVEAIENIYNTSDPDALPNLTGSGAETTETPVTQTGDGTTSSESGEQTESTDATVTTQGVTGVAGDVTSTGTEGTTTSAGTEATGTSTEATGTSTETTESGTETSTEETTGETTVETGSVVDPSSEFGVSDPVGDTQQTESTETTTETEGNSTETTEPVDVSESGTVVTPESDTGVSTNEGGETA